MPNSGMYAPPAVADRKGDVRASRAEDRDHRTGVTAPVLVVSMSRLL